MKQNKLIFIITITLVINNISTYPFLLCQLQLVELLEVLLDQDQDYPKCRSKNKPLLIMFMIKGVADLKRLIINN